MESQDIIFNLKREPIVWETSLLISEDFQLLLPNMLDQILVYRLDNLLGEIEKPNNESNTFNLKSIQLG